MFKKIRIFALIVFIQLSLLAIGSHADAQAGDPCVQGANCNPLPGGKTFDLLLEEVKTDILKIVYMVIGGVIIVSFVLAGFKYLKAQGDPGKIEEANKMVLWAILGVIVIILAWSIMSFVNIQIFGLQNAPPVPGN